MRVSLIITTYNWPESLILVLRSIENQTIFPEEVVIADDGSTNETKNVIAKFQKESKLTIIHSWQEDYGFRVAKSRNKAIAKSSGDYIILIDGDVILGPKFIRDHIDNAEPGYFVQGTRVLLNQNITQKMLTNPDSNFSFLSKGLMNRKNTIHSNLLSKFFSKKKNYLHGVKTCNMAFFKQDCINVNGFNNEFEGWGKEDSEFVVRLLNNGIDRKNVRFNAIQYHLWHKKSDRKYLEHNREILRNAIDHQLKKCDDGINKYI